jgi:hypothetical protein
VEDGRHPTLPRTLGPDTPDDVPVQAEAAVLHLIVLGATVTGEITPRAHRLLVDVHLNESVIVSHLEVVPLAGTGRLVHPRLAGTRGTTGRGIETLGVMLVEMSLQSGTEIGHPRPLPREEEEEVEGLRLQVGIGTSRKLRNVDLPLLPRLRVIANVNVNGTGVKEGNILIEIGRGKGIEGIGMGEGRTVPRNRLWPRLVEGRPSLARRWTRGMRGGGNCVCGRPRDAMLSWMWITVRVTV